MMSFLSRSHTSLQTFFSPRHADKIAFIRSAAAREMKKCNKALARIAGDERADYKLFIKQITLLKRKIFKTILEQTISGPRVQNERALFYLLVMETNYSGE
jgi:hypothetical protein